MSSIHEVSHPLILHHLSRLRDKSTSSDEFRMLIHRLAVLLAYEATQQLQLVDTTIQTPLTTMTGKALSQRIGLVPILRAGLGMVDPVLNLIPTAEVWHLGLYRDEATAQPVEYYSKLPQSEPVDIALVLDPMLATGGSVHLAIDTLRRWGVKNIKVLSVIASQAGIDSVASQHADVQVYVCAIDPELNSRKFIVPGLGDAGDRIFNTIRQD